MYNGRDLGRGRGHCRYRGRDRGRDRDRDRDRGRGHGLGRGHYTFFCVTVHTFEIMLLPVLSATFTSASRSL